MSGKKGKKAQVNDLVASEKAKRVKGGVAASAPIGTQPQAVLPSAPIGSSAVAIVNTQPPKKSQA